MANIISNENVRKQDYLQMSNGLTSVFIDTICLGGSEIAENEFQKELMIWFAQRDWQLMGLGIIGFDVAEIIWDKEIFTEQKSFILKTLERSLNKTNWELLGYNPREEWVLKNLNGFKRMISEFESRHIEKEEEYKIIPFEDKFKKCNKHKIYLHVKGCVICNNE